MSADFHCALQKEHAHERGTAYHLSRDQEPKRCHGRVLCCQLHGARVQGDG